MIAINYILLILAIVILFYSLLRLKELDTAPVECRKSLQKDVSLMIVSLIMYIILEAEWIAEVYYDDMPPVTEMGWASQEALTKIIFWRWLYRMQTCPYLKIQEQIMEIKQEISIVGGIEK